MDGDVPPTSEARPTVKPPAIFGRLQRSMVWQAITWCIFATAAAKMALAFTDTWPDAALEVLAGLALWIAAWPADRLARITIGPHAFGYARPGGRLILHLTAGVSTGDLRRLPALLRTLARTLPAVRRVSICSPLLPLDRARRLPVTVLDARPNGVADACLRWLAYRYNGVVLLLRGRDITRRPAWPVAGWSEIITIEIPSAWRCDPTAASRLGHGEG